MPLPALVPDAPARVLEPTVIRCRVVTGTPRIGYRPTIPVVYPAGHDDKLLIVEAVTETPLAEIRAVTVDRPSWVLNGVGTLDFTCSTWDDAMDHLVTPGSTVGGAGVMQLVGREIQWYRDGVLRWAGPPVTGEPKLDGTVQFNCMDLGYYLYRKFFGAAERRDLLLGIGSMDVAGLPGWTLSGSAAKARDNIDKARGAGSMVLSGTGAVTATFNIPARPVVPPVHLTLMAKIPTGTEPGTTVATITVRNPAGGTIDEQHCVTDEQTPLGAWVRFSTHARQARSAVNQVTITLWSPNTDGSTKFDDVRSLENNTTGIPTPGADLSTHGVAGVRHVQFGRGQTPGFGITPVVETNTGTVEVLGERHLDHKQLQDFLSQYTDRADGFDWYINPRSRQIRFCARRGVDHTGFGLHERSVSSGGWVHDESQLSSKIVVPGEGDGVDRPEGGYTDTSRTAGLVLDYFHQPPANTPLSALDPMAEQVWDQKSQPQLSFDGLSIPDSYLGTVNEGDTIPANLTTGKFRLPIEQRVRIGKVQLDLDAGQLVLS